MSILAAYNDFINLSIHSSNSCLCNTYYFLVPDIMLGTHLGIESKVPAFRELTFQTKRNIKKKMFMRRKRKFYHTLVV